jgi:hypothetical protein
MNSYDLECMELVFFLIFLFFERGTVIDIILQNFRLLNMALKAHILQVFPINMALKAHILQTSHEYGPKSPYSVILWQNSYFKQDSFPKVLNFLSVTVLNTYAGTHGF